MRKLQLKKKKKTKQNKNMGVRQILWEDHC